MKSSSFFLDQLCSITQSKRYENVCINLVYDGNFFLRPFHLGENSTRYVVGRIVFYWSQENVIDGTSAVS